MAGNGPQSSADINPATLAELPTTAESNELLEMNEDDGLCFQGLDFICKVAEENPKSGIVDLPNIESMTA